jgi:hypothetical protein
MDGDMSFQYLIIFFYHTEEAARIRKCKGRVFALQNEPEVARVWMPNMNSPGLAMARAFGDFCLKDFGLISVPEISYHRLTDKDEFVVLATDGVGDLPTLSLYMCICVCCIFLFLCYFTNDVTYLLLFNQLRKIIWMY